MASSASCSMEDEPIGLAKDLIQDSAPDTQELNRILNDSESIEFSDINPHRPGASKFAPYENFKSCTSIADAKTKGASQ